MSTSKGRRHEPLCIAAQCSICAPALRNATHSRNRVTAATPMSRQPIGQSCANGGCVRRTWIDLVWDVHQRIQRGCPAAPPLTRPSDGGVGSPPVPFLGTDSSCSHSYFGQCSDRRPNGHHDRCRYRSAAGRPRTFAALDRDQNGYGSHRNGRVPADRGRPVLGGRHIRDDRDRGCSHLKMGAGLEWRSKVRGSRSRNRCFRTRHRHRIHAAVDAEAGAFSGLAMGLAGLITGVILPLAFAWVAGIGL